jgi:hypothetical protein
MKPFVDIEGSGEFSTKITSTNGDNRAVIATNDTELRFLTVEKKVAPEDTGLNSAISVENESSANNPGPFQMTHVTATASGGNGQGVDNATEGMDIGRFSTTDNVKVALTDATVRVLAGGEAIGVRIFDGTFVTMNDVNVTSGTTRPAISFGVENEGFTGIRNSMISARSSSFHQEPGSAGRAAIIATRLVGPASPVDDSGEGPLKCAGVFDQNYRFCAENCPGASFDTGSPW